MSEIPVEPTPTTPPAGGEIQGIDRWRRRWNYVANGPGIVFAGFLVGLLGRLILALIPRDTFVFAWLNRVYLVLAVLLLIVIERFIFRGCLHPRDRSFEGHERDRWLLMVGSTLLIPLWVVFYWDNILRGLWLR